ncbi:hypothetical protein [Actinoallomurus sp. NPDC052274]|uniref:hypothetical protein n=1 Tax=Actinoallomurus sp. NPDC052274 TaxID=3155420 RepID=UPI00341FA1B5
MTCGQGGGPEDGDSRTSLVFVGMSADGVPEPATDLCSRSPSEEVDATFTGMGISETSDFPVGSLGGIPRCGRTPTGGGAACAWAD